MRPFPAIFSAMLAPLLILPALARAQKSGDNKDDMQDMQMGSPSTKQQSPQKKKGGEMQGMPGMGDAQMQGMKMGKTGLITMQGMQPQTFLQAIAHHATSGTSAEPNSTPTPMLMVNKGPWMLMFHANVFLAALQQSSSRGGDKFFSTNWFMEWRSVKWGPVFSPRA
jgi:hypothetical protein